MNFSNYLEVQILGATLLGSSYTSPATVWMSLSTTIASDGDFYTEVASGLGYLRQPVDWSSTTSPNDTTVVNSSNVLWAAANTPWGNILHFAIHDAEAIGAGNMLYWGDLQSARNVQTTDVLEFLAGNLTVRLD